MSRFGAGVILAMASVCFGAQSSDAEEHRRGLETARQNALAFTMSLPEFTCSEAIRRFRTNTGTGVWRETDLLVAQLTYSGGKEDYQLVSIDNRPARQPLQTVAGAVSNGEFGSWLRAIFDPASKTEFRWERRDTIGQRKVGVYSYKVARANSHYDLNYRDGGRIEAVTVGHHGLVYLDAISNRVLRLVIEADSIPARFPLKLSTIHLEYGFAEVAGREYLLPLFAETHTATAKLEFKNELQFWEYRRFEALATLHFGDPREKPDKVSGNAPAVGSAFAAMELDGLRGEEAWMFPPPPPPGEDERHGVLAEARRLATEYAASLPNFVCTDLFRLYQSPAEREAWNLRGTLTVKLEHFAPGRDVYELVKSDGAAQTRIQELGNALRASGWNSEFKRISDNILENRPAVHYRWDHWTTLRGRVAHVYSFAVNAADSRYAIKGKPGSAVVGQHGLVYVDQTTTRVLRIFAEADAIPPALAVANASVLLDFDFAKVADDRVLLPLRTVMRVDSGTVATRYESEFQAYTRVEKK